MCNATRKIILYHTTPAWIILLKHNIPLSLVSQCKEYSFVFQSLVTCKCTTNIIKCSNVTVILTVEFEGKKQGGSRKIQCPKVLGTPDVKECMCLLWSLYPGYNHTTVVLSTLKIKVDICWLHHVIFSLGGDADRTYTAKNRGEEVKTHKKQPTQWQELQPNGLRKLW